MASPFRLFRKHQKAFLVIAGVLAIFIFVVGDAMMGCVGQAGGDRRAPNVVVTSWKGGSLTVQEMNMLYQRRLFISDCLSNLYQEGKYRVESGGETPIPPRVPTFFLNANAKPEAVMARCVEERIFADQAREIGMAVSDDIDPSNTDAIFWSLAYRANLGEDLHIAPYKSGGHGPKGVSATNSALLVDATLKQKMTPLALPARAYMEQAKAIWEELGLPALTPQPPWHGYSLGDWTDVWEEWAQRAVSGEWERTGIDTFDRRQGGLKPETPVRSVKSKA